MVTHQEERPLRNKCEVYNDYDTEYSLFAEYGDTHVLVANVSGNVQGRMECEITGGEVHLHEGGGRGNIFGLSMRDLEGLRKMCEMILACYRGK